MPDDAALLRRYAQDRCEDAFAELVRRHIDGVFSTALRRLAGDKHLAEDVTQQVFVALARKAAALSRHPVLTGWLYLTTRHESANAVRSEQRRKAREQAALAMNETPSVPEPAADWSQVAPVLDQAIDELGEHERAAVLLRFVDRRGFAEIGSSLHVTEDAARMRVERALDKLRTCLARRGITSTSAALSAVLANHVVTAAPAGLGATVIETALAAPALTGSALGLLQLMSSSKILVGGAALIAGLTLVSPVREMSLRNATEDALAAARSRNAALAARLETLRQQTDAATRAAAEFEKSRGETLAAQAAEKQRLAADARATDLAKGDAFVARHPEIKRLYLESQRAQAAGRFALLFKKLRLSPEEIERFKDLAAPNETGVVSAPCVTLRFNTGGTREAAERELRALLGPDGFKQYQDFSEIGEPANRQVAQLAGALFDTASPLTASQGERLLEILIAGTAKPEWAQKHQLNWDTIISAASRVLSDDQLSMLRRYQAEDELGQAMYRARMAQAATPTNRNR